MDSSGYRVSNLSVNNLFKDHAHPTWVGGHPFKGGWTSSIGQLAHPDMKRFQINTPVLFSPPNPSKEASFSGQSNNALPSFNSFYHSYFGIAAVNLRDSKCSSFLSGMKKCFDNNPTTANSACAYYVDGFKRSCSL